MRTGLNAAAAALLLAAAFAAHARVKYPVTRQDPVVEDYHGVAVADPYRWLEDDNAPEVKAWVEAQNAVTAAYLARIPEREAIRRRLTELWNYERFGIPTRRGGRYFYARNDGLQNQSVLYVAEALDAEPRVLIDPNTLAADGTVSLTGTAITEDARRIAFGTARSGSDWQEWRVRDVDTGEDLPDVIRWVKFSGVSWLKDGSGFFYSRFDEPPPGEALKGVLRNQKLCFHRLGTDQSADRVVYERPDQPEWTFHSQVTDDGRWLIIHIHHGTDPKNRVYCLELSRPDAPVVKLLDDFDASYNFVDNDGPVFWFHTDLAAPRGRVIAVDTRQPERAQWREVIPQAAETLQSVGTLHQMFVAGYLRDAQSQHKFFRLDGQFVREVALPGIGTAAGFGGRRDERHTFYQFTSFTVPGRIYQHDAETGESALWRQPAAAFNPDDFETKQVFYASKDGTRVPMFITHRKGLKLDGRNPTLLYGYGGFNISLTPAFSVTWLAWMELGGVFAQPNLRGGGEYGEAWHRAGTKLQKQNVFDDFIAAAEWLIANRYTRPSKLAIAGGSNGGLLVGAAMTQRPELFGAALPAVGVLDMLRFHKFTIGWAWTSDYGSSDDPEEFRALLAYSPYHNLRPGTRYPATLITTADHDDRVVPAHSFKFAARLQETHRGARPVLIRIETQAGHGAGKPTTKLIEEAADRLAFLVRELGVTPRRQVHRPAAAAEPPTPMLRPQP